MTPSSPFGTRVLKAISNISGVFHKNTDQKVVEKVVLSNNNKSLISLALSI
jgi:hypothetical protein